MADEKKPLLSFSTEKGSETSERFHRLLLDEVQRRIDVSAEILAEKIVLARLSTRKAEIHIEIVASRISLEAEGINDRLDRLERAVRRLEKPKSGPISGLFRRT